MRKNLTAQRFNATTAGNTATFGNNSLGNPTVAGAAIFKKATLNATNPAANNDAAMADTNVS